MYKKLMEKNKEKVENIANKNLKINIEGINRQKGITLIALVVTIVILIILATVAINVVLGEGGIIQQAKLAKELASNSMISEEESMNTLMAEYANIMASEPEIPEPDPTPKSEVQKAKEDGTVFEKKTPIRDEKDDTIMVPAGFKIAEDSGDTVQQGIVIEDVSASTDENVQGSQYVWIPVGTFVKDDGSTRGNIQLARYTFSTSSPGIPTLQQSATNYTASTAIDSKYTEAAIYNAGYESIQNGKNATAKDLKGFIESTKSIEEGGNGGYYIGRYEASYASGSTASDYKAASKISTGNSTSSMSYTNGTLWNFITQPAASKVAINTYAGSASVTSDLINSYAWDTAIVYIQEAGNANYANQKGTDINTNLANTGENNDEVCKINDMASNIREWTTEHSIHTDSSNAGSCVYRGGVCNRSDLCTAYRDYHGSFFGYQYIGFRVVLYVK